MQMCTYCNRPVADQDGYAGSKFLEQRHRRHWQLTEESNQSSSAGGTIARCAELCHTVTRAATEFSKATSVLVQHQPHVWLLTVGQVPVGKTTR